MRDRRTLALALTASFVAILISTKSFAAVEQYKADPAHSSIVFRAKHLDTAYVYGRFDNAAATISFDESDPSKLAVEATVQVDSVNTGNAKRDGHLKSPDFFSAKEFPTIKFKSTSAKSAGDNKFEVSGNLTFHGQTKPITVTLERTGSSSKMGPRVGWLTMFTIKRSEFGMTFMPDGISDEIELTVSLETVKG